MKKLIVISLFIVVSSSHGQINYNRQNSLIAQSILIKGKIYGYQQGENNAYITFRTYDFYGRLKDTSFYITPGGSFTGSLSQPFESDIAVMYRGGYLDLYYSPGEKLYIEINEVKW